MAFLFIHNIDTTILINAPPSIVRAALLDFASYPDWCTAHFKSVEVVNTKKVPATLPADHAAGGPSVGTQLRVELMKGMIFTPEVMTNTEAEFAWLGSLLVRNLFFDGRHHFIFKSTGQDGQATELIHGERFVGLLSGLMKGSWGKDTKAGFLAFNEVFKKRCEDLAAAGNH